MNLSNTEVSFHINGSLILDKLNEAEVTWQAVIETLPPSRLTDKFPITASLSLSKMLKVFQSRRRGFIRQYLAKEREWYTQQDIA